MIAKKNPKADLEKKRFAFFQIGLILAGAFCLAAFEYTTIRFSDIDRETAEEVIDVYETEIPRELFQTQQPQRQRKIEIETEERQLVDELPPKETKTETEVVKINLSELPNIFNDDGGEGFVNNHIDTFDNGLFDGIAPEFPGGEVAMAKWIVNHIDIPDWAYPLTGTVYVSFVVNRKGEIVNVKVAKGIDETYDEAALAVVQNMPKWTPGEQAGKPVAVRYHIPIRIVNQ